jgi:hypothetical protein
VTHDEWFWRFTPSQPLSYNSHYFVSHSWPSSVTLPLSIPDPTTDWIKSRLQVLHQTQRVVRPLLNRSGIGPTYWHFYTQGQPSSSLTESYKYIA